MFTRDRLAFLAAYAGLSIAFCWPLFAHPLANGLGDWDQHTFYYATFLRSLAWGDLPFWNPWYCGGNVLWQNPQVSLVSPIYPLALVMPIALAMKIYVLGNYMVGCLGAHLVIRRIIGVTSPVAVISLVALAVFSGGVSLHLAAGHSNYLSILWLPALVYCFFRAAEGHARSVLAGAAIVGFAVMNAAPHFVPLAALLLGSLALAGAITARTLKPLLMAVVIVGAGCLFAAPKLIPAVAFAQSDSYQDRRPVKHPDYMSAEMFVRALWDGSQTKTLKMSPGVQKYAWHEYGNYMGWFGAALSIAAAVWILLFRWRATDWRETACAVSLVLMLLMGAGEFASYAPATLLQQLPIFSNFRIPSRHLMLASFLGAACIAFVVRARRPQGWSRTMRQLAAIFCAIGVSQLIVVNRYHLKDIFILPPTPVEARHLPKSAPVIEPTQPASVQWTRLGENSNMLRSMAAGVSQLDCYEPLAVRRIAPPGPATIRGEGPVALSNPAFSPNRVAADTIVGSSPVRLVLNQNFADGWSSNVGPVERDPGSGLPSVVVPAGYRGVVAFTFAPRGFVAGLVVWMFAVALSVVVWRRAGGSAVTPRA